MNLKNRKVLMVTVGLMLLCVCIVCFASRSTLIFVGNSYENSQDINTIISLNDKIVYSGFIKAYELPRLLEKRNMKIGFYKVSAKLNNVLIEQRFFYFLQKTIWIDFDCANSNSLLISKYYRQIPLYISTISYPDINCLEDGQFVSEYFILSNVMQMNV